MIAPLDVMLSVGAVKDTVLNTLGYNRAFGLSLNKSSL